MPIEPAQYLVTNAASWPPVAIDPAATRVAFIAVGTGTARPELFVRSLDQTAATIVPGSAGVVSPVFSPDGQWIAFIADGSLKKVPAAGGPVQTIAPANGAGVAWVTVDTIVVSVVPNTLMRVSAQGGKPEELLRKAADEALSWPVSVPGMSSVIFAARPNSSLNWDDANIDAVSIDGSSRHTVLHGGVPIRVLPAGFLIFRRGSDIFSASFDLAKATVSGSPVPILDNVRFFGNSGTSGVAVSDDATIAYIRQTGANSASRSMLWMEANRTAKGLVVQSRAFEDPRVSPDGQRLAFEITSEGDDIWVLDLRRDAMTRLTFDPGEDETPVWSPDGKWIAYAASHTGAAVARNVFRKAADGSGAEETLFSNDRHIHVDDWSRDSRALLLSIEGANTQTDIWVLPLDGKAKAQPVLSTKFNERNARLSPDGRWISYTSNESGMDEVYVQPYPSLAGKWQISTRGGDQAVWSRNGRTLYYRGGKQVMSVDVTADATLQLGTPRVLFEDVYESKGLNHTSYDVGADGKFLFVRDNDNSLVEKYISVVENLLPEIKKRLGLK